MTERIEHRISRDGIPYRLHWRHWLPRLLRVPAITVRRDVYVAESWANTQLILEEERHVTQWTRLGTRWFVGLYVANYLFWRLMGKGHAEAYRRIIFEREAKR